MCTLPLLASDDLLLSETSSMLQKRKTWHDVSVIIMVIIIVSVGIFRNYSGFMKQKTELKFQLHFFWRSTTNRSEVLNTHARRLTL